MDANMPKHLWRPEGNFVRQSPPPTSVCSVRWLSSSAGHNLESPGSRDPQLSNCPQSIGL